MVGTVGQPRVGLLVVRAVWLMVALTSLGAQAAAPLQVPSSTHEPAMQALVFFNARLALRDGNPTDALRLWLVRNALVEQGTPGTFDAPFLSVVWASLGNLGLCQDGLPTDSTSAGLWPLALHNWVLRAAAGHANETPTPYDSFEVGRQMRLFSLHDVLSAEEINSATFFATDCLRPAITLLDQGDSPAIDVNDRLQEGVFLRQLLTRSLESLNRQKVQGVATVEARIFDLDLALAELEMRLAHREALEAEQQARFLGVSAAGAKALGATVAKWPENSLRAQFLRRSLTWSAEEWLNLSHARRLFLFSQARPYAKDLPALRRLVLRLIDSLIASKSGDEVQWWVATLDKAELPSHNELTDGERGKRLLELEPSTGFHERATISLHRGVHFLESGNRLEALRSFAFAMAHADESREAAATLSLARRWLSFLLARYETNDEVVATLRALVPKPEFNLIVEDLLWKAALKADATSFERLTAVLHRGSSLDERVARLNDLAHGQPGALVTKLRDLLQTEPSHTLRFCRVLLEHLETEDATVRLANAPMLRLLIKVLDSFATTEGTAKSQLRLADEIIARAHSMLDALNAFGTPDPTRTVGAHLETFAGNIRLAPGDVLPWPFNAAEPESPSAFEPLTLVPVEWRDAKGDLVFGWRITE